MSTDKKQEEEPKSPINNYIKILVGLFGAYATIQQHLNGEDFIKVLTFMVGSILIVFFVHTFLTSGNKFLQNSIANLSVLFLFILFFAFVGKAVSPSVSPFNLIEVNPFGGFFGSNNPDTPDNPNNPYDPIDPNSKTTIIGKLTCNGNVDGTNLFLLPQNKKISLDAKGNFSLPINEIRKDAKELEFKLQKTKHKSITIKRNIKQGTSNTININDCLEKIKEVEKREINVNGKFRVRFVDEFEGQLSFKSSNTRNRLFSDIDLTKSQITKGDGANDAFRIDFEKTVELPIDDSLVLFCHLLDPKEGYSTFGNPMKIGASVSNLDFRFEKIRDLYFKDLAQAEKESKRRDYDSAIRTLNALLENGIYETENQHYEILMNKARYERKAKKYKDAAETLSIITDDNVIKSLEGAQDKIDSQRKVYWEERFDVSLKFRNNSEDTNSENNWNNFIKDYVSFNLTGNESLKDFNFNKQVRVLEDRFRGE